MIDLDKTALDAACRAVYGCAVTDPFGYDAKPRDVLSVAITAYLSALPAVTEEQVEADVRGPFKVKFMGPAVYAAVDGELPDFWVDKTVWVSTFDPSAALAASLSHPVEDRP